MFLYIKTNILRGYGIFKNDFAHPREPANTEYATFWERMAIKQSLFEWLYWI